MGEKWIETKLNACEGALAKISELPQPVGIVLFGADCNLKETISQKCVECIPNLAAGYGGRGDHAVREAKRPLSEGQSVLTVMPGENSIDQMLRSSTIQALKNAGAKTIVGIYAKCEMPATSPSGGYYPKTGVVKIARQVRALLEKPPLPGEFNHSILVEE